MIFTEPLTTSIDANALVRRWGGHAAVIAVVFLVGFVMASPSGDERFRKGFLVETTRKRTQDPFRTPDSGVASLTPGEELGNLFQVASEKSAVVVSSAVVGEVSKMVHPVIAVRPRLLVVSKKPKTVISHRQTEIVNSMPEKTVIDKEQSIESGEPPAESLLSRVRKDPSRIYIDQTINHGDLSWTFRNATNDGIEFLVSNKPEAQRTYYLPKVSTDGKDSFVEGSVIAPGDTVFGVVPGGNFKSKRELQVTLRAAGAPDKKARVKLLW